MKTKLGLLIFAFSKQTANLTQLLSSKVIVDLDGRLSHKVSAITIVYVGLAIEIKALYRLYSTK